MPRTYVQINDPHVSDQPPRMRLPSYLDDVLAKLGASVDFANEIGADGIVITGDLFHRKNATHTTHRTVQRVRDVLYRALMPVHLVPGNHDEANGGGLAGQPLLSIPDGDRIHLLSGPSGIDPLIAGVPWNNAFERAGGTAELASAIRLTHRPLVFAHAPITDRPFPFGPEAQGWVMDDELLAEIERQCGEYHPFLPLLIAHGHMHGQQPIRRLRWYRLHELTFSNPGALSRGSVAEADVARVPSVARIVYDGGVAGLPAVVSVEYYPIPHRPAADVLRIEEHERDDERATAVQRLATSLAGEYAEVVDEEVLRAVLQRLARPADVDEETWRAGLSFALAAIDGEAV